MSNRNELRTRVETLTNEVDNLERGITSGLLTRLTVPTIASLQTNLSLLDLHQNDSTTPVTSTPISPPLYPQGRSPNSAAGRPDIPECTDEQIEATKYGSDGSGFEEIAGPIVNCLLILDEEMLEPVVDTATDEPPAKKKRLDSTPELSKEKNDFEETLTKKFREQFYSKFELIFTFTLTEMDKRPRSTESCSPRSPRGDVLAPVNDSTSIEPPTGHSRRDNKEKSKRSNKSREKSKDGNSRKSSQREKEHRKHNRRHSREKKRADSNGVDKEKHKKQKNCKEIPLMAKVKEEKEDGSNSGSDLATNPLEVVVKQEKPINDDSREQDVQPDQNVVDASCLQSLPNDTVDFEMNSVEDRENVHCSLHFKKRMCRKFQMDWETGDAESQKDEEVKHSSPALDPVLVESNSGYMTGNHLLIIEMIVDITNNCILFDRSEI